MTRPMSLMIDGWMPSVGSSRTSRLGAGGERAGDRELLLLAAGEVAAAPLQHRPEDREELEQLVRQRRRSRLVGQAHGEVLRDREAAEDLAPLRHVADAPAHALVRRLAGDVVAVERDRPERTGTTPIRLFSSVVLPTPLRPRTTVTSPAAASSETLRRMCEPP